MSPAKSHDVGNMALCARDLRATFLSDPHRPRYHFCASEGIAMPFDPNGCLYWKGRHHMFYIFQDRSLPHNGHCWGHVSSADLLHWVHHPTALAPAPGDPDTGIFSGCALVSREGVPTIIYLGVAAGICTATSEDDGLDRWTKCSANPVIPIPKEGGPGFGQYNVHDPHVWLEGDTYYAILNGRGPGAREYDYAYLFKSADLVHWEYLHPFYEPNPAWTFPDEDCACPDFFKLGDRHMLLAISHSRGARYYLGRYEDERFYPEEHHRMNWPGGTCFAPESLLDDEGRRIMWAWVLDRRGQEQRLASGWSGTMTLPRVLSLGDDRGLRIAPVAELETLRGNHRRAEGMAVAAGAEVAINAVRGDCMELKVQIETNGVGEVGLKVRRSPRGEEETAISYDAERQRLRIDVERSSLDPEIVYHTYCMRPGENPPVTAQEAPLELAPGEPLKLRVFIDRSILEVFANGRQCVTQRIYPTRDDSLGVSAFSRGRNATVTVDAWDVAPTNAW